jgi:hypothetical protein
MESPARISPASLSSRSNFWPALALIALLAFTVYFLYSQGRFWICTCGYVKLWAGDIWSNTDNSQHIFDPYTFSHIQHGFLFYWLVTWALPRLRVAWRLVAALTIEAGWEMFENSSMMIRRYNEMTISKEYTGDTIINSLSDLAMCGLGFWVAHLLGFRITLVLFIAIEVVMILWIRDSMLLNIIMLLFPIDALRDWQMGL